jgi:hypothetical protein
MMNQSRTNDSWSAGLRELLAAAVVSLDFQHLLLKDARAALRQGYNGRALALTPVERRQVLMIEAHTLPDFVAQLAEMPPVVARERAYQGGQLAMMPFATAVQDVFDRD